MKLSSEDIIMLSKLKINGREIKNLIRLAGIIVSEEKISVSMIHFNKLVKIMKI